MNKINWCKKQERGIQLIAPSDNLSTEYLSTAEESLHVLRRIIATESNMWLATTKYYIEYFAFYAVLMKLGIKCEINDCSLALAEFLAQNGVIEHKVAQTLKNDKELRIDNQYYLKNKKVVIDFSQLSEYMLSVRRSLDTLEAPTIEKIREILKTI